MNNSFFDLYQNLSSYDWLTLWRHYVAINILFVGILCASYYVILKQRLKQWSQTDFKNTFIILVVVGFLFSLTFAWAMGFFDDSSITGFNVSVATSIIFVIVAGSSFSIACWYWLKNNSKYWDSLSDYLPHKKRRQKKINKYISIIKQKKINSIEQLSEDELYVEAENMLVEREIRLLKIMIGFGIVFCLVVFFPHIFIYILYNLNIWP